jgi:hypothetical protein
MKRNFIILAFALIFSVSLNAQNTFNKGDKVVNLGIGLGSTLYSGAYYKGLIPPVSASLEVGIKDNLFDDKSSLGVGAYAGFASSKWEYLGYGWRYTNIILGARASLHYQLIEKLDTYGGFIGGFRVATSKEIGTPIGDASPGGGIVLSPYIGGRYYFSEKLAAMAELGYGIAYLNIGIALKL